jgi:lysophospholipase L1-like esterase
MLGTGGEVIAEVHLNEEGFRGPCFPKARKPGTLRIACLGDSYTFGWMVEEECTYPRQMEHMLNGILEPDRIEVMNFGHPGYNTRNELRQYSKLVKLWNPDIVILGYVLNDTQPEDVAPPLTDNFLFRLLGRTAILEAFHRHVRRGIPAFRRKEPPGSKALRRRYRENREVIQSDPEADVAKPYWASSLEALEELVHEVRADGSRFLLLIFPGRAQFLKLQMARQKGLILLSGAGRHGKIVVADRKDAPVVEREVRKEQKPQDLLFERARSLGVLHVDLLPSYVALDENPFHPDDPGHPGALGYRVAAEEVVQILMEEGWLLEPAPKVRPR